METVVRKKKKVITPGPRTSFFLSFQLHPEANLHLLWNLRYHFNSKWTIFMITNVCRFFLNICACQNILLSRSIRCILLFICLLSQLVFCTNCAERHFCIFVARPKTQHHVVLTNYQAVKVYLSEYECEAAHKCPMIKTTLPYYSAVY